MPRAVQDSQSSDDAAEAATAHPTIGVLMVLAGFREPIVVLLLTIAFFTTISGKPLDGVLMLLVAVSLAIDAGRRIRNRRAADRNDSNTRNDGTRNAAPPGAAAPARAAQVDMPAGGLRRALAVVALVAGGALYAGVVGSFSRYSWPATVAVIGLGTVVVLIGWRGPLRHRQARDRLPAVGTALWGGVFVAGCLWELAALLRQPSLEATSYTHPTISAITDPVLASAGGRSVVLAAWLAIGWYVIRR